MKPTSILYSQQKPFTTPNNLYNKENLSIKSRPPPLQPPFFLSPFFTSQPLTTKANFYENQTSSFHQKPEKTDRSIQNKEQLIEESLMRLNGKRRAPDEVYREIVEENVNLKVLLLEKVAESDEYKRKLCDERVEKKITSKKLESLENKIKELLKENEKLNLSLNSRLEQGFDRVPKPKTLKGTNISDFRETLTQKDLENRVKSLSFENERLFKENEGLICELKEIKVISERNDYKSERGNQRNLEEIKTQFKENQIDFEEIKTHLMNEKDQSIKELKIVEGQLEQYKTKAKDLENELLQSHVCISDLEKRLKSLMNNQESLNNSVLNMSRRGNPEEEIKHLKGIIQRYKQENGKVQEIMENKRKELEIVKRELEKIKKENRKLIKLRLDFEEKIDLERKEKDEYKELIENQSVILREKEVELDDKLMELDEIRKGFLDISQHQNN